MSSVYLSQLTDTDCTATEHSLLPEPTQNARLHSFIRRYKLQQLLKTYFRLDDGQSSEPKQS